MKIKGKKISGPSEVVIPVVRGTEDIFFKARAVLDFTKFDQLCKMPKPPMILRTGDTEPTAQLTDEKYKLAVDDYAKKRSAFMIIESLSATEDLVWEKVDKDNPDTWLNYDLELRESGLNEMELARLINGVLEANGLDSQKIEEAKKRFLASQQVKVE